MSEQENVSGQAILAPFLLLIVVSLALFTRRECLTFRLFTCLSVKQNLG